MTGGICGRPTAAGPPCKQPLPAGRTWCGQCKGPVGSGSRGADRDAARDAAAAAQSVLTAQPEPSSASELEISSDTDFLPAGRVRDPASAHCYMSRGDDEFDIESLRDGRVDVEMTEIGKNYPYDMRHMRFSFDEREAAILVTEFAHRFGWSSSTSGEADDQCNNSGMRTGVQAEASGRRGTIVRRQPSAARAALSETGRQLIEAEAAGLNTPEERAAFDKLLAEHEQALQALRGGAPIFADSETRHP